MTRPASPLAPEQRQTIFWLVVLGIIAVLLYMLTPVLTPFLFAAILGYMLNPGVDWLARHRLPRWLAVLLMVTALFATVVILLLTILPVMQKEFVQAQAKLPLLLTRIQTVVVPRLSTWLGTTIEFNADSVRQFVTEHFATEGLAASVFSWLKVGGMAAVSLLVTAVLVPMVLFYLLIDWTMIWARLDVMIPRRWHDRMRGMAKEIDVLLAQYLRGQVLVMLALAAYYSAALALAGFDIALPVGLFTGLLAFIPYLGYSIGLILALIAAALQFGDLYGFAAVAVVYGLGQVLENFFLVPRLVGERIGLHPIAVIFALLAFGELFGFFGILLALPASAALLVGLTHLKAHYLASEFYRRSAAPARARRAALELPDPESPPASPHTTRIS